MKCYDFSHEVPEDFDSRIRQLLDYHYQYDYLAEAFNHCSYELDNLGNAYQNAGMRGDNWNKDALDVTFEGPEPYISTIKNNLRPIKDVMSKALKTGQTGLLIHEVLCICTSRPVSLPRSNEQRFSVDLNSSYLVLEDIVRIGEKLSINATYDSSSAEDSINDYVRDQLSAMGYEVLDQTRHGKSSSGINAGEVDLLIKRSNRECALIEALKLSCVDSLNIQQHIKKALTNYNPLGTPALIIAYVSASSFSSFWDGCFKCIKDFISAEYAQSILKEEAQPNASTKIASVIASHEGYKFPVFFVALNLFA